MSKNDADIGAIDDAARLLYHAPPEEFIARRNALVKDLRAAGSKDLAGEVKALRKPSVVAAELNRIARAEPEAVAELIAAALALRAAQDEVMSGRTADLAEPRHVYRAAVARVAGSALRHQVRVESAVQAAAADPTQHAKLRDGTFAAEPELTLGFEGVPSHVEERGGQPTKGAATSRTTGKAAPTQRQLTAAVRSAEKALNAADSRLRAAKETLAAAAAAAAQLDEQAASLEEQLAEIQRAQAKAQTSVAAAQSGLDQATEAHEAANRELTSARQLLNDLDTAGARTTARRCDVGWWLYRPSWWRARFASTCPGLDAAG